MFEKAILAKYNTIYFREFTECLNLTDGHQYREQFHWSLHNREDSHV